MRRKPVKPDPDWVVGSAGQPVTGRTGAPLPRSPSEMLEPSRPPGPPGRGARGGRAARRERPPQRGLVRFFNATLTVLLVLMLGLGGAAFALKYEYEKPGPLDHSTVVVIPPGEGAIGIANRLQREGVVTDSRVLLIGYYWTRMKTYAMGTKQPNLKAGEYEIRKSASMRQVLETLVEGKAILYKVTVPEGLTSYQIVQILKAQPDLTGDVTQIPPEGSLLPDTYKFSRGADRNELIARMQADQKRYAAKQWDSRSTKVPFKSLDEALIMASLVEKETGKADEREHVASVFINRLAKHMRLQSDPTIIYYLTEGQGNLGRGIYKNEIEDKNPYNTYQIEGLPPTPICNPGRASIEAVLNPATTDDLFFVADGSGGHAFADNIRDHQKNVQRWRQLENASAKAKAAAGQAAQPADQDQSAGPGVALDMPGVTVEGGGKAPAAGGTTDAAAPADGTASQSDGTATDTSGGDAGAATGDASSAGTSADAPASDAAAPTQPATTKKKAKTKK